MAEQLTVLIARIDDLLRGDPSPPSRPLLGEMEHTLTDGYARALSLEGERRRTERRIGELVHELASTEEAGELRSLSAQLRETDDDLARLRSLLEVLSERTRGLRSGAAESSR